MKIEHFLVEPWGGFSRVLAREARLIHASSASTVGHVNLFFELEEKMATTPILRRFECLCSGVEYGEHLAWEFLCAVSLPGRYGGDETMCFLYENHEPWYGKSV